jgi:hypothetical protein
MARRRRAETEIDAAVARSRREILPRGAAARSCSHSRRLPRGAGRVAAGRPSPGGRHPWTGRLQPDVADITLGPRLAMRPGWSPRPWRRGRNARSPPWATNAIAPRRPCSGGSSASSTSRPLTGGRMPCGRQSVQTAGTIETRPSDASTHSASGPCLRRTDTTWPYLGWTRRVMVTFEEPDVRSRAVCSAFRRKPEFACTPARRRP